MKAAMAARPTTGPTTAPAIQALDFFFFFGASGIFGDGRLVLLGKGVEVDTGNREEDTSGKVSKVICVSLCDAYVAQMIVTG
jgi:hypothetical protein